MSLKVEIIQSYTYPRLLGIMETGNAHPFTNYNPDGSKELVVFRCDRDGTKTDIFKAKEWTREVDPATLEGGDFELVTTLNPGEEYYINANKNSESNKIKLIRFAQDSQSLPDILTRLSGLVHPQRLN